MTDQTELPGMPAPVLPVHGPPYPDPFEVRGTCEVRADVTVDLAGLIRAFPDEYAAVDMGGYAPWERPMNFLWQYLEEESSYDFYGPHVKDGFDSFEFDLSPRWSEERFNELVAVCPEARITEDDNA